MIRPLLPETLDRVERASSAIATRSVARMEAKLPWFRCLPADQRAWIVLIAQAGIASMVRWLRHMENPSRLDGELFDIVPRALTRAVRMQDAVSLVGIVVQVLEDRLGHLAAAGDEAPLREAVLYCSREFAFTIAEIYSGFCEVHGGNDASLQAELVDALLRDDAPDALATRFAALGWTDLAPAAVVIGTAPPGDSGGVLDAVEQAGRNAGIELLAGVQAGKLVVIIAGRHDPIEAALLLLAEFGEGPVVVGDPVPTLADAGASARAATAGLRAVVAWTEAPRPVYAADLLPERALAGDAPARDQLLHGVYEPLAAVGGELLATLTAYFEAGESLERAARLLFVHPNTVRHRWRRVAKVCALSPTVPRDAFVLRVSLAIGRLEDSSWVAGPVLPADAAYAVGADIP